MERLSRFLSFASLSSPPILAPDHTSQTPPGMQLPRTNASALLALPAEIIHQILTLLDPISLADLSQTCHLLHSHAEDGKLWYDIVQEHVPAQRLLSPGLCKTWRDLYAAHHPYWFLTRHKLWFSDKAYTGIAMTGSLIVARFDPRRCCIEAYRLVAEQGDHTFEQWALDPSVIIHAFNPRLRLWLDDPVIKLNLRSAPLGKRLQKEILMPTGNAQGIRSLLFRSLRVAPANQNRSMLLWPPEIIPTPERVRNHSPSLFRSDSQKPKTLADASDTTFRIRKWMEFGSFAVSIGLRMGEDVMTFSTLPEDSYTPTKEKPWRGIWVGDYAGHGCEFLVVLQPDEHAELSNSRSSSQESSFSHAATNMESASGGAISVNENETDEQAEEAPYSGRLEAIKLTGDPNVPRGEYTFIADDIGRKGFIRIAEEQPFLGARVVKSRGHVAARGFINHSYIPSELIMMSHDRLAQYWVEFGHISFYSRVNIDDYLGFNKE
ncbi:Protein of unknown function DUF3506 [Lasallia pustulata]|uniref:F-box domain-containing protein n=1 Tax=Lasallia pustulata TaxID=136370 RepID=A0A1W5CXB6_9LECA|nr:Protein of unknown function DUF3506 [Lasallia pustulata]